WTPSSRSDRQATRQLCGRWRGAMRSNVLGIPDTLSTSSFAPPSERSRMMQGIQVEPPPYTIAASIVTFRRGDRRFSTYELSTRGDPRYEAEFRAPALTPAQEHDSNFIEV